MNQHTPHHITPILKTLIAVTIVTLVILFILLIQQYQYIQRLNFIVSRSSFTHPWHTAKTLQISAATSTQAWMTFEYINHLFSLPPAYLQSNLSITDSHYPRITIAKYAESIKQPVADTLTKVVDTIQSFSTSTSI